MPLSGTMLAAAAFAEQSAAIDLGVSRAPQSLSRQMQLGNGTGAGKADKVFSDRRTIAASANDDLDLAGVLLDAFGATITFARVKGLFIAAAAANTNNLIVGAAATNPWAALLGATGTLTVRPGGFVAVGTGQTDATGYTVTPSTGDMLRVTNGGAGSSVTYDIHIIGASA
ncbi:hypothetical protein AB0P02_01255 [Streptomyces griseoluteus]|uniref:hypothetical protein n=1 Tax=Streptomyces griseoluteus TaxID=29306 RepID=UPI00344376C5